MRGFVYINHGRMVCDCPYDDCTSAMQVQTGDTYAQCVPPDRGGCGRRARLEWPPNIADLMQAMAERPERNRNWFPAGHPLAELYHQPSGETPDELRQETRAFIPEIGTVPLPDEDAEAIDRILRRSGYELSRDLLHVRER